MCLLCIVKSLCFRCCWCFWFIFARDFRESAINRECQQNRHIGTYSTYGQQLTSKCIFCKFLFDFTLFSHCPYDYPRKTHTQTKLSIIGNEVLPFFSGIMLFSMLCIKYVVVSHSCWFNRFSFSMYMFITTRALLLMSLILIAWLGSIN